MTFKPSYTYSFAAVMCQMVVLQSLKFLDRLQNEIDNVLIEDVLLLTVLFLFSVLNTMAFPFPILVFLLLPHFEGSC